MKKITLLLAFVACALFSQAQTNLLTNPGFETWTNGTSPDGWTMGNSTYATVTANTTLFSEGTKSFKVTAAATNGGTYIVSQIIPITPSHKYRISMDYYIENGDGTDARIWSDWCNVTGQTTTYATLSHADSLLLFGPGGGSAYFPDVRGVWHTYTCDVVAPATGYNSFSFQFRTYKTPATVDWDNMYFADLTSAGVISPSADVLNISLVGRNLSVSNATANTVEIFNTVGAKVQSSKLENGSVQLNNLSQGVYVVRVGKQTAKIVL